MGQTTTHVRRALGLAGESLWWSDLYEEVIGHDHHHHHDLRWPCSATSLAEIDGDVRLAATEIHAHASRYIIERQGAVIGLVFAEGYLLSDVYGATPDAAEAAVAWLKQVYPEAEPEDENILLRNWCYGPGGPMARQRQIAANTWEEIAGNYEKDTHERLAHMVEHFDPGVGGQLILFSGLPGSGKTTALRAIAREWRDWCSIDFIMDPEKFFGDHADYLSLVLFEDGHEVGHYKDGERLPWRLIVLEDAGELLRKDASEVTGKALGRLLNTVDGMIGQGLRIMVLVTTNEEIGKLHDAIARPGRCAVEIQFDRLDADEADVWREAHGLELTDSRATLAELYAELEGFHGARQQREEVGFL